MKETIRQLGEHINQMSCDLRREVVALENHMNECNCNKAVKFSFTNITCKGSVDIYCLSCGGYIDESERSFR